MALDDLGEMQGRPHRPSKIAPDLLAELRQGHDDSRYDVWITYESSFNLEEGVEEDAETGRRKLAENASFITAESARLQGEGAEIYTMFPALSVIVAQVSRRQIDELEAQGYAISIAEKEIYDNTPLDLILSV